MQRLEDWIERLSVVILWFGAVALVGTMLLICADVFGRYLLSEPIPGTLEIVSSYMMVAMIYLPIAYVQARRQNVMVDLFTMRLNDRAKAALDMAACAIGMVYVGLLTWLVFGEAVDATHAREFKDIYVAFLPVWPARWFLVISFGVMFLVFLLQAISDAFFVATGEGEPQFRRHQAEMNL